MRKKVIIVLDFIAVGILICLFTFPALASKIDDIVLLEKAHPGYWNNLSESTAKVFYVDSNIDTYGGHGNLLVLNHRYYVPSTLCITTSSNGTLKIQGKINDKAQYMHLTSHYYIGPGNYVLSLGRDLDWSHMYAYLEHYDSLGNKIRITSLNSD